MTQRTGGADLPLHGGRVPRWLGDRMTKLGVLIAEAVVRNYGRGEFLKRLVTGPDLKEIVAAAFGQSAGSGGRSVFGWEPDWSHARFERPDEAI